MERVGVEEVYKIAQKIAPAVMFKLGIKKGSFSHEDVVSEYCSKFIEKDYSNLFNPEKGNLRNFIWWGLKNTAIDMGLREKFEVLTIEDSSNMFDSRDHFDLNNKRASRRKQCNESSVEDKILIDEILEKIGKNKFQGIEVVIQGKKYKPNFGSIVKLMYFGYTQDEIAGFFQVSRTTVCNVLTRIRGNGICL